MAFKVTWKKGMRLSTEVFEAVDSSNDYNLRQSILLASNGRMGLFKAAKPFELSVNITNSVLEVVTLSCHGITKNGKLVDIDFDSNFNHTFDTRVAIPTTPDSEAFILTVKIHEQEWREVSEMLSEPKYSFAIIGENNIIEGNSFPVGRLVNQYGWRLDEIEFVPPCLYVSAHAKYLELVTKAKSLFKKISDQCLSSPDCIAKQLISIIWPSTSSAFITLDKDWETMTPNQLYSTIQQIINSFLIGCSIDAHINLENKESFISYVEQPFDNQNVYNNISKGLDLCAEISGKMDVVSAMTEIPEPLTPVVKPKKIQQPSNPDEKKSTRKLWEGKEI